MQSSPSNMERRAWQLPRRAAVPPPGAHVPQVPGSLWHAAQTLSRCQHPISNVGCSWWGRWHGGSPPWPPLLRPSCPFSSPTPPHRHRLHVFSFYTCPRAAHHTHLQLSNKYTGSSPEIIRASTRVLYLQCFRRGLIVKLGTSKCNSVCY